MHLLHLPSLYVLLLLGLLASTQVLACASDAPPNVTASEATTPTESQALRATDAKSRAGDIEPAADFEAALTSLLDQVVTEKGLVRYDLLRGSLSIDFRHVLKAVEDFDASTLTSTNERLAFWMNAYNVQMLQNIIETPEVKNIVDDGYRDPFFKTDFRTAQMDVSLDAIENVILRGGEGPAALAPFQLKALDPRIHVGLNCAAISCPRLRQRAFTATNVDAELDAAMRDFTGGTAHFRVEGDSIILSSLLDWFSADFDRPDQPAGSFLLAFMPTSRPHFDTFKALLDGKTAADLKQESVVTYEYKWKVNAAS